MCYKIESKKLDFSSMDRKQYNTKIGALLKNIREEKKMTQADISALMNINSQNISSYERGERCPSLYWILRFCQALDFDILLFYVRLHK